MNDLESFIKRHDAIHKALLKGPLSDLQNLLSKHFASWNFYEVPKGDLFLFGVDEKKETMKIPSGGCTSGTRSNSRFGDAKRGFGFYESGDLGLDEGYKLILKVFKFSPFKDDSYFDLENVLVIDRLLSKNRNICSRLSLELYHNEEGRRNDILRFLEEVADVGVEVVGKKIPEFSQSEGLCFRFKDKQGGIIAEGESRYDGDEFVSDFYLDVYKLLLLLKECDGVVEFFSFGPKNNVPRGSPKQVVMFFRDVFEDIGKEEYATVNLLREQEGLVFSFVQVGSTPGKDDCFSGEGEFGGMCKRSVLIGYCDETKSGKLLNDRVNDIDLENYERALSVIKEVFSSIGKL